MDERVFSFKYQVYNWLREAEMEHANTSRQSSKKGRKSYSSGAPGGRKQAAVLVILADHQRREL